MRSHCYGTVAFVKQLVNERVACRVTGGTRKGKPTRSSKFENMIITPSIIFGKKALDNGQLRSISRYYSRVNASETVVAIFVPAKSG